MLPATLAKAHSRLRHEIVPLASHCPTVTLINTKIKTQDRLRGGEDQRLCNQHFWRALLQAIEECQSMPGSTTDPLLLE